MVNNREKFVQIFNNNKDMVHRICFTYSKDIRLREDLFQEVWLNVWRNLEKFEGKSKLSTWIFRITTNTCLLHQKWENRRSSINHTFSQKLFVNKKDLIQDSQSDLLGILYQSIERLDQTDRIIITMLLEGFSYDEISEETDLSVNHVGVKIHRIKQELKRDIEFEI